MKANIRFPLFHFLCLSLLIQAVVFAAPCLNRCICPRDNLIDCSNPTFPMVLPARVIDNISIRGKILNIPANAFIQPEGNVLKSLSIYNNEVLNIESHAFNNLVLDGLSLYNIQRTHLGARVFTNMTSERLSIYNSDLNTMPAFLFGGTTLTSMSLYNNNITSLETNVFKSAKVSKNVALYNNRIDTIQKNAFNNDNLKFDIYLNKIKKFYVQDSVIPRSFYSNKIICTCSLAWMWKEDSIFNEFLERNKCLKTSQYGEILLKKVNQTWLCMNDNSSQTSEWETFTSKLNTEQFESSQPISKETPGTEDTTQFATTKSSDTKSASLKPSVNLILIIIESVVVCLFMLV